MSRALPSGTVTLLFTDVEGSTRLLHELGAAAYADALADHRRILREAFVAHGGVEVDTQGDAFFVAFPTAPAALATAADLTRGLAGGPIRVRVGIHTGSPLAGEQGYVGVDVHRAARIAAAGHGGQVLVSASTASLVDSVGLRDLGEHRLKDLSAPERIYQLGDGVFPPLKSLYQTNLPFPATPFLGREHELAEIAGLLSRPDVRLLTLTGPGGTGKTRLGLQAAAEAAERYPDGVYWVPLAPLRDPQLVLASAAQALAIRDGLADHIADKHMLLLIDNFEHLIDAALDVSELLAACPNLCLLVTSRELLRIPAEHAYPVPPLEPEDGVELFLARARTALPTFVGDEAVPEVCARLEQLPLAIELAAARVRVLSPAQLLVRLSERLDLLKAGRGVDPRQQTLRTTIEWSHELLDTDEQHLFAQLAVFRGGCTLEAAEKVCNADLDTLQSLVDKSLLRHTADRYWMLETIRAFADEQQARAGESEAMAARHADYFVALAEHAEPFFGTNDEATWLDTLAQEQDNFRAALGSSAGSWRQLRLACALWRFWLERGHHTEGQRWLETALTASDDASATDKANGLRAAAVFARIQGDLDASEQLTRESIAIARQQGDRGLEMHAIGTLANIAIMRSDYPQAAKLQTDVEALARELGNERAIAVTLGNRAYLAIQMSDYELALTLATESLALSREMGDSGNVVSAALNLALAAQAIGERQTAAEALAEAIERASAIGHRTFLVSGLVIAASMLIASDPQTAAALLAATDRAQTELTIELDPVERGLRASVETQLHDHANSDQTSRANDTLDAQLDNAASRAIESLATSDN